MDEVTRQRKPDVYLCYHKSDQSEIKKIARALNRRDIRPWLDEWEARPGLSWQRILETQISSIKSAAVFVGKDGIGPWQDMEIEAFLREFVRRRCPVIPVLLASASEEIQLPLFLHNLVWVDFRCQDPNPMNQLIWGITGNKPNTW